MLHQNNTSNKSVCRLHASQIVFLRSTGLAHYNVERSVTVLPRRGSYGATWEHFLINFSSTEGLTMRVEFFSNSSLLFELQYETPYYLMDRDDLFAPFSCSRRNPSRRSATAVLTFASGAPSGTPKVVRGVRFCQRREWSTPRVKGAIPQWRNCRSTRVTGEPRAQQRYLQMFQYKGVHRRADRRVELLSPRLRRPM